VAITRCVSVTFGPFSSPDGVTEESLKFSGVSARRSFAWHLVKYRATLAPCQWMCRVSAVRW
jgi:hypothetical protein